MTTLELEVKYSVAFYNIVEMNQGITKSTLKMLSLHSDANGQIESLISLDHSH